MLELVRGLHLVSSLSFIVSDRRHYLHRHIFIDCVMCIVSTWMCSCEQ